MAKLKSGTRIYGTATIDTSVVVGSAVTLSSSGIQVTGISTLNNANATQLQVTGVSTFTNGPVLVGTATSTGTAGQVLQVAGINSSVYIGGNLGVGNTNPGAKLDVFGTSRFGGTVSAGRRADIDTGGRLTLTYGDNANQSNLTLQNTSDISATTNHGNNILWQFGTNTTTTAISAGRINILKEQQWTTTSSTQDAYLSIDLALDGSLGEKVRVTSSGSVGIGTTNPTSTLTVVGNGLFSGTGIVTATTFVGGLTGTASTATTANNVSDTININTTGIITATGGFVGTLTGTASTATTALGFSTTASINTSGIITASQLDLSANASTDDSVLYLSGAPLGTSTKNGLLGIGQLSFSDTDIIANFVHDVNGYAQVVVQNKNSGASSSADIIVNNDRSAGTTYYGDFGINGTTFSAGGVFGDVDGTYLYAAGGTLSLGSLDDYAVKIATNSTERVRVNATGVGIGTTNPAYPLQVQGDVRVTGAFRDSTNSPGTSGQFLQSTQTGTQWVSGPTLGLMVASTYNMFMP